MAKQAEIKHACPDGQTYRWTPRKKSPKACPRCKSRLDAPKAQEANA